MKRITILKHNLMRAAMTLALILACATAWADNVETYYIDASGQTQSVTATVLTGNESSLGSYGTTWYVVNNNITHSGRINYNGNVNIILADGCTMTTSNDNGDGIHGYSNSTLTIYGQTLGTGTLEATSGSGEAGGVAIYSSEGDIIINGGTVTATATSAGANCINAGSVTINGGTVTASATGSSSQGINAGSVTINGGTVTASGTSTGIKANRDSGTITLGWTNATDQIHASSYSGTVNIADGKALKNGGTVYYGTLTAAQKSAIANVTLQPATQAEFIAAALPQTGTNEYTIYDSVGWNAFCLALDDNDTWNRFSGKTVKLGADIGTAQDPITRMAGGSGHDMKGTFDGQGYTLTIKYGTAESPITAAKAAPFVNVESGCIIENLHVAGDIYTSGQNAAGIAGTQYGAVTIRNCRVSTAIHSYTSGDGTHGGLVGNNGNGNGSALSIVGCVFDGKLLTEGATATIKCGGFVGWRHSEVTISNSLFAPTEVTIGTTSSATFARNGATITNCYYTTDFNDGEHFTAQGKQRHSITADENVTVAFSGTANEYQTSGITAYKDGNTQLPGLKYGDVLYAGNGDEVSLTLNNSIGGDVPEGYQYAYSTNAGTLEGSTLTMPDADVIVSAALRSTGQFVGIGYYINNDYTSTAAIALDGTESSLGKIYKETWYFVGTDISHSGTILCSGNVNIILAYGKTMTITSSDGDGIDVDGSLTIYGQDYITGTLNVNSNYTGIDCYSGNITISGGTVNATGNITGGIYSSGNITISDSRVTATGGSYGIYSSGNITIGCAYASDFIYASSYVVGSEGTLNIADGKAFTDGDGHYYRGTLTNEEKDAIGGKRLYPDCVVMKHITGYGNSTESDHWVFIASPVVDNIAPSEVHNLLGQKISTDPEPALYDFDFYRFNQSADLEWQNYHQHNADATNPFNTLVNGQGYLYATKEDRTLVFSGEYPSGTYPVEVPLDYDENADLAGWNLVGNPFEVGATLSQPFYRMNPEGTALSAQVEAGNTVEAMEGVFVQATAANQKVTFTAQTRGGEKSAVAALNISLSKLTDAEVPEPVEGPTQNNGVSTSSTTLTLDNAILRFDGGQTLEKFSFREGSTKIYIPQDGTDYAIACAESTGEMPVNFKAEKNGTYTLTVSTTLNSQLSTFNYLHLIDNMTGADVDLLTPPAFGHPLTEGEVSTPASYTFTAKTTDYASRFKLVFVTNNCDGPSTGSGTFAFMSNGSWIITNEGEATLQVIDMLGRVISSERINGSVGKAIHAAPGVYVIRLVNGNDIKTQKVVVR